MVNGRDSSDVPTYRNGLSVLHSLVDQTKTGYLCDVLFYDGGDSVWAHSCILAAFSSYFFNLFSHSLKEDNHWSQKQPMQISLSHLTKCKPESKSNCIECLTQVVKFIYTGDIKLHLVHLSHVFILCDRLKNKELSDVCESFRRKHSLSKLNLDVENVAEGVPKEINHEPDCNGEVAVEHEVSGISNKTGDNKSEETSTETESSLYCNICSYLYDDQSLIKMHSRIFHSNRYKCLYCSFSHKSVAVIVDHIETQCHCEQNLLCSICLYKSSNQDNLLSHVKIHKSLKPFQCSTCKRSFDKRSLWLKHLISHVFKKTFQCTKCELAFNTEVERAKHFKLIHGPKKHVCSQCGFAAPFLSVLEKHQAKHRKSTFTCEYEKCEFRTSSESMLVTHKSTHRPKRLNKVDKSKECPICKMKFTLNKNMVRHMSIHETQKSKLKCHHCNYETLRRDKFNEHVMNKHYDSESTELPQNADRPQITTKDGLSSSTNEYLVKSCSRTSNEEPPRNDFSAQPLRESYNVESSFSQNHNKLMMNDVGDISIVNGNEENSIALTLRNIGNLTGSITLDERTGVLTMNNINSGSVFLNEITGELTYINLENDKHREINYFNSDSIKQVDNFKVNPHNLSSEVTKLDEFTGEIIKVLTSVEDNFPQEQEFDCFDMDVNDESLDGFDDFDELLFDVFNEKDVDFNQVILQNDAPVGVSPAMPHLDESTGLLTFCESLSQASKQPQDVWNGKISRHRENNSQLNDNSAYSLMLDEVTGVLHD